jgi:hypothetical protein
MKLSVLHPDLTMLRIEIDGQIVKHETVGNAHSINIDRDCNIEIFFEPWKIKPLIRLDRHLIDYWLANVTQFDHMIKFHWGKDFYKEYQQKIVNSKMQYLGLTNQDDIDYYLGINNAYTDIVENIRKHL